MEHYYLVDVPGNGLYHLTGLKEIHENRISIGRNKSNIKLGRAKETPYLERVEDPHAILTYERGRWYIQAAPGCLVHLFREGRLDGVIEHSQKEILVSGTKIRLGSRETGYELEFKTL